MKEVGISCNLVVVGVEEDLELLVINDASIAFAFVQFKKGKDAGDAIKACKKRCLQSWHNYGSWD